MKLALVLGAGGLVGVAHHVGVVKALEEETGVGEPSADLVVGTSAGSAVGAYLRSGRTATELIERATDLRSAAPSPSSSGVLDAVRHGIGSAYIVARTSVRIPSPLSLPPFGALRRAFPAGLVTMGEGGSMLERELPRSWPERRLWLGTYDLVAHRRVVLGRPGEPYVSLPAAVKASCAIPGVYPPVRAGGAVLVDGGAWSLTNVDLAAVGGCRAVVCIAPMAFDPGSPPGPTQRLVRELSTRSLFRTVARLKRQGVRVVVLAPGGVLVRTQGLNLMRASGLGEAAPAVGAHERAGSLIAPRTSFGTWPRLGGPKPITSSRGTAAPGPRLRWCLRPSKAADSPSTRSRASSGRPRSGSACRWPASENWHQAPVGPLPKRGRWSGATTASDGRSPSRSG